jgi:hypothetical protein
MRKKRSFLEMAPQYGTYFSTNYTRLSESSAGRDECAKQGEKAEEGRC